MTKQSEPLVSLTDLRKRGVTFSIEEIVTLLMGTLCELHNLHSAGAIHGNLSPDVILLRDTGEVKFIDPPAEVMIELMQQGLAHGGVWYTAPEFIERSERTPASDLYAVGMLGFELITGRSPFEKASNILEALKVQMTGYIEPPSFYNPSCPKELDSILLCALARDPTRRYQSASEMLKALDSLI